MSRFYLIFLIALLTGIEVTAQTITNSPQKALNTAFQKGSLMTALSGIEHRPGLNLAAAKLAVGQTISLNVTLLKDEDYVFLASGPTEQTDVDLYLRDATGTLITEDLQQDGTPIIEFTPSNSGTYQLQLHLAAGDVPESFVALSLLRQGGRQISEQEYQRTSNGFFAGTDELTSPDNGAAWQQRPGTWCLFGYALRSKEGISLGGVRSASGRALFTAAGPKLSEIDLYLADGAGEIAEKAERPEAFPLLQYYAPADAVLDLRVEVKSAKSHVLVLVGVLEM